ncbi:VOC family protein [Tropicimonas marinistellae]|uniref:VOC family protein n=1 Tax=Tropicimonas marinistellae TaxID=1739787 RepID=UPI000830408B|nr:VOC family protein [Tropicimonas marinistellae]
MFDHLGIIVSDVEKAHAFYVSCTAPLGIHVAERHPNGAFVLVPASEKSHGFLYIGPDAPAFWSEAHALSSSPVHICFTAPSKSAVDRFFETAVAAGGTSNGVPGERHPGYYAAYVIDSDGNNIEAAFRER